MKHYHFQKISSTLDYAKELLQDEIEVIVTAEQQLTGKNESYKDWVGDWGKNVYLAYAINHKSIKDKDDLSAFMARGCLAALESLIEYTGTEIFKLRYPNDVMAKSGGSFKKIASVFSIHNFVDNFCTCSGISIGINVMQEQFPDVIKNAATSLKLLGLPDNPDDLQKILIGKVKSWKEKSHDIAFSQWEKVLDIKGKIITIPGEEGKWKASNLQENGNLLIISPDGSKTREIGYEEKIRYEI